MTILSLALAISIVGWVMNYRHVNRLLADPRIEAKEIVDNARAAALVLVADLRELAQDEASRIVDEAKAQL